MEHLKGDQKAGKKISENGSNGMESETNAKDHNGDLKEEDGTELKKPTEEKSSEEKTKKRLCDSSPSSQSAKRTKSSQGLFFHFTTAF